MIFQMLKRMRRLPISLMLSGWAGMGVALQRLFVLFSRNPALGRTLVYLEAVQHLRKAFRNQSNADYPVLVINRDRDVARMARFRKTCEGQGIRFERLRAVDLAGGQNLPEEFRSRIGLNFYGRDQFLRGAVGCFLSHATAWRAVLDGGHAAAFVCEDDATFLAPLPSSWEMFSIPEEGELIFANQRMAVGLQQKEYLRRLGAERVLAVPASEATIALQAAVPHISGLGTDGYLVTRRGAARLLEILEKRGITMEVDWFLFFYAMTPQGRRDFIAAEGSGRFDGLEFSDDQIRAHVFFPFWVEQDTEASTIDFTNPKNYVGRAQLLSPT
jgi:GR25 family glycosyltransferase involved in LPS biosynthesis